MPHKYYCKKEDCELWDKNLKDCKLRTNGFVLHVVGMNCQSYKKKENNMKFSKEYSKLQNNIFTTIRKNTGFYKEHNTYTIITPSKKFKAFVMSIQKIKKADIDDSLARNDADMSSEDLIKMLEKWYGKKYNDFILIEFHKE